MATQFVLGASLKESGAGKSYVFPSLLFSLIFLLSLGFWGCSSSSESQLYRSGVQHIPCQRFDLDASQGGLVTGASGSIFAFGTEAFTDEYGNAVRGKVEVRLQEARSHRAILAGGLITQSGDRLLATDGMYHIEAFQGDQRLKLNPSANVQAWFPTDDKNPEMGLYLGNEDEGKLDWKLLDTPEGEPGYCDKDEENRQKCNKCKRLLRMTKSIRPGKKPKKDEYWVKRHYWENGVLYFASSGSRKPILSQKRLDDCKDYLKQSEKGRDLLAKVEQIKQDQVDKAGEYYSFRIRQLGWYNMDRLLKDDLIAFSGKVVDESGAAMSGAKVHLFCKKTGMRVHIMTTTEEGGFNFEFVPGEIFSLYAYRGEKIGQSEFTLDENQSEVSPVTIARLEKEDIDTFLEELL